VAASEKAKAFVVEAKKIESKAKKFKDKLAAEEKLLANVRMPGYSTSMCCLSFSDDITAACSVAVQLLQVKNRLAAIVAESKRDTAGEDRRRQVSHCTICRMYVCTMLICRALALC